MTAVNARAAELSADLGDDVAADVAADLAAESAAVAAKAAPSGVDRRERLRNTIESLIKLRQDVAKSYARLAGVTSIEQRDNESFKVDHDHLRRFCQMMVDYTAMGHFEVYQRIIDGNERRQAVRDAAADTYPAIAETTDYLIDFNDKFDDFDASAEEIDLLTSDLSRLGEILVIRGKLEDQILVALAR